MDSVIAEILVTAFNAMFHLQDRTNLALAYRGTVFHLHLQY
jgi:hypothetical protein